jgi:hypothetical protein
MWAKIGLLPCKLDCPTSGSTRQAGQPRVMANINNDNNKKSNRLSGKLMPIIGVALALVGLVTLILEVYQKVTSGHGLDTYFTFEGVQMNYIGVIIVLILIPIILISAWIIYRIIERRENNELNKMIKK